MSSETKNDNTEMSGDSSAEQDQSDRTQLEHEQLDQEQLDQEQSDQVDAVEADVEVEIEADSQTEAEAAVAELAAELAAEGVAEEPAGDGPHLTIVPVEELSGEQVRSVIEAALFAADEALTIDRLFKLFVAGELGEEGGRDQVRTALSELEEACEGRGFELKKVASGYRMQVRQNLSPWVSRLWEEKPPRYTRALLETMALIAYKQPATRGDIEEVRGVAVSSNIMRTLLERGWIREIGHRDVPGRPSMYGTTKEFLDYFNLSSLDQLPSLPEVRELVEPAQIPVEPAVALVDEAEETGEPDSVEEQSGNAQDDTAPVVVDADSVDLQSVDVPDSNDGYTTSSAPVFADNEVLVVNEAASVEVQHSPDVDPLPAADRQE